MKPINVFSPTWVREASYGRLAREISTGLKRRGYHVNRMGNTAPRMDGIQPCFGGVLLGYPTLIEKLGPLAKVGPRIILTMFESTQLPPLWTRNLNMLDAVIVPTPWLVPVFRDNGVTVPIYVHRLGVKGFKYIDRPIDRRPFTFLCFGDRDTRKGWREAGQAFLRLFGDSKDYKLIIKVREQGWMMRSTNIANENIEIIKGNFSDKKMRELYGQTDCLLFPTKGEGQGLPPLEYAATGGTVIATNWGGTADNLAQWGLPINYKLTPAWDFNPFLGGLGEWAEPDIEDLMAQMQFVVNHREYMHERGKLASAFVRKHYTWGKLSAFIDGLWSEVGNGIRTIQGKVS